MGKLFPAGRPILSNMCTATLIPGFRLAFNRDESPTRPAALPPVVRCFGTRRGIMPIDPVSDGTWIAVNDAGLVLALLNRNPSPPPGSTFEASRGTIIPSLLHCDDLASAQALALELAARRFAPFRLILADRTDVLELAVRDGDIRLQAYPSFQTPLMFTSSGLGDELVRAPRQQLFDEMFAISTPTDAGPSAERIAQQERYHRHSWPDRRAVSVCMERDRARTVSYTIVELNGAGSELRATLTYHPQPPDQPGTAYSLSFGPGVR